MKYAVWSSYFIEKSPEEMVKLFLDAGFDATEISFEHLVMLVRRGPQAVSDFRKYMDDLGFTAPQGHLNFAECRAMPGNYVDLASFDEPLRRASIDSWKEELECFETLGVKRAVLHPGGMKAFFRSSEHSVAEIDEHRLKGLVELLDFTKGMDVRICLENMAPSRYMSTSESLLGVIRAAGRDNIGICLDTGHLNIQKREEHADFIRACGPYLQALHIADNSGASDEHLAPYGGTVDWESTVAALKETGYTGLFNLEIPGTSWRICHGDPDLKKAMLAWLKILCQKLVG